MIEGWNNSTLGDVGTFQRGGNFLKSDFVDEGFPCLHYGQIHQKLGTITKEHLTCIPYELAIKKAKMAQKGDVILAITSEDVAGSCKCTAWMGDYEIAVGAHTAIFHHSLNPLFVSYYFQSPTFHHEKEQYTHGFKVVEIRPTDIAKIPISYPSPAEQQRIVDVLDAEFAKIDALKANAEKNLQNAKDLFRVSSDTYFANCSNLYYTQLGKVCSFVRGPFGGSLKKSCFVPSGYAIYEQQHAIYSRFEFRYFIDEAKFKEMKRFAVQGGDLIMSCSGTIGKVAIVPQDAPEGIINQALLKLRTSDELLVEYLAWYMNSLTFEKLIHSNSQGVAIQNVASVATLKQIPIPVPPIPQQENVVQRLNELNERCNTLQENYTKTIALCDDLKQALLRKAFNGEL